MYICQDKCNRLVPVEDHKFAQAEDYLEYAKFCGLCIIVLRPNTQAWETMLKVSEGKRRKICPCCKSVLRAYFEVEKKKKEIYMKKIHKKQEGFLQTFYCPSECAKVIVETAYNWNKKKKQEKEKTKTWKEKLKVPGAPTKKRKKTLEMIAPKQVKLYKFMDLIPAQLPEPRLQQQPIMVVMTIQKKKW